MSASAVQIEDEVLTLSSALALDPQSLFIYAVLLSITGLAGNWVYKKFFYKRPISKGLGKNAPGFLTAVGKAYVENPNPGRQLVEVDHRHLYQTDSHSAPQDFSAGVPTLAPSTLSASQEAEREKKEKEQAKWESNEWLPQGHVKKRANADGAKKGKGKK